MTARAKLAPNLLTPEQHKDFDAQIKKWQSTLGLQGWRVERSRKKTRNMAEVEIHHKARLANYRVGDFGAALTTPHAIESTALHELLHVLLYGLKNQVEIGLTDEALDAEEHSVIHLLEKLLLPGAAPDAA